LNINNSIVDGKLKDRKVVQHVRHHSRQMAELGVGSLCLGLPSHEHCKG